MSKSIGISLSYHSTKDGSVLFSAYRNLFVFIANVPTFLANNVSFTSSLPPSDPLSLLIRNVLKNRSSFILSESENKR